MLVQLNAGPSMKPEDLKTAILTLQHGLNVLMEEPLQAFAALDFENTETGEMMDALDVMELQRAKLTHLCNELYTVMGDEP